MPNKIIYLALTLSLGIASVLPLPLALFCLFVCVCVCVCVCFSLIYYFHYLTNYQHLCCVLITHYPLQHLVSHLSLPSIVFFISVLIIGMS